MSRRAGYPVLLLAVALGAIGVGLLVGMWRSRAVPAAVSPSGTPPDPANPYARFRVADFALTDQDARQRTHAIFEGRVTVLTFFFTSCPDPCPAIQRAMADVQGRTAGADVRLVSVSVDGEHDTPERVRDYAAAYGADFARWTFLTGPPADVGAMVRDTLAFNLADRDDQTVTRNDGTRMAQILHPTRLVLVGPDRRALGLYAYNDPDAIDRLVADAIAAAR